MYVCKQGAIQCIIGNRTTLPKNAVCTRIYITLQLAASVLTLNKLLDFDLFKA